MAPRWTLRWRVVISLAIAFAVEASQLYQAAWLNEVRRTTLGALLLGRGFLWSDLVCYAVGIFAGAVGELAVLRRRDPGG